MNLLEKTSLNFSTNIFKKLEYLSPESCSKLEYNVRCYISVAEKHKTMLRLMTENNKYKQIIKFNPITAIEYSSCYNSFFYGRIVNFINTDNWITNLLCNK